MILVPAAIDGLLLVLNKQWGVANDISSSNKYIFFPTSYTSSAFATVCITNGTNKNYYETDRSTDKAKFTMGGLPSTATGFTYISIGQ